MREFLSYLFLIAVTQAKAPKPRCKGDIDPNLVGRCLRPLLDKWESVKEEESHATRMRFPIIFYTRNSLLELCAIYSTIEDDCLMMEMGQKCSGDELIMYANAHFRFWCGPTAPLVLDHFTCISSSLLKARHCQRHLIGMSTIGNFQEECQGVPEFYKCSKQVVEKDCGQKAKALFSLSIVSHGCTLPGVHFEKEMSYLNRANATGKLTMDLARKYIRNELTLQKLAEIEKLDMDAHFLQKKTEFVEAPAKHQVFKDTENGCTKAMENAVTNCYLPIADRIQELTASVIPPIRLPLYNFNGNEITQLCSLLEHTKRKCISAEVLLRCDELKIRKFIRQALGPTCEALQNQPKMARRIDCTWKQLAKNTHCKKLISGEIDPGADQKTKCGGMTEFLKCSRKDVVYCGDAAFLFLQQLIAGYGCDVEKGIEEKVVMAIKIRETSTSASTSVSSAISASTPTTVTAILSRFTEKARDSPTSAESIENKKSMEKLQATNGGNLELDMQPVTIISPNCSDEARNKSLTCIQPLMETWKGIREQRPALDTFNFPIYQYTKVELLELCDGYANTFLCAGFEPIEQCLDEDKIRLAQDQLGYLCSPNHIGTFMRHFDCVFHVNAETSSCRAFLETTISRTNTERCVGVKKYRECLLPELKEHCDRGAGDEFEETILQYGCNF